MKPTLADFSPVFQRVYWIGMERMEQLFIVTKENGIKSTEREWAPELGSTSDWMKSGLTMSELETACHAGELEYIGHYSE